MIEDPDRWFTPAGRDEVLGRPGDHGTVGCIALDKTGGLAAATSTGGTFDKVAGRVGDTPIFGAGFWAEALVAVMCTGIGEHFVRTAAAVSVARRMTLCGDSVGAATHLVAREIDAAGGAGAILAMDRRGNIAIEQVAAGLKFATAAPGEPPLALCRPPISLTAN